jgi:hypothetical protein
MRYSRTLLKACLISLLAILPATADPAPWDGTLVERGTLREAVGEGQHQARADLAELNARAHFYSVGAVSELKGEVTVLDGHLVATQVTCCGNLLPADEESAEKIQATMLLGAYVEAWNQQSLGRQMEAPELEKHLRELAGAQPWSKSPAFPFLIDGELRDAKVHVLNGACPVHARMQEITLPDDKKAFEATYPTLQARVIGFFADRSVGVRTHPGTSLHAHIVFIDPKSGMEVTGHLERFSVAQGAKLSIPR